MAIEGSLEIGDAAIAILILQRLDLGDEVRVRAERALRKGDQCARQDIGAFDRDADWHHLIGALQIIGRAVANAPAAMNIERVVDALAHAIGRNIFEQRRDHGRLLAG